MINHAYWPILLPALAIIASVAAFYLLADGIRRRYDLSRT
jgi:ABC-type dipeptide/oligopeptide/nickel transport system permease subunit